MLHKQQLEVEVVRKLQQEVVLAHKQQLEVVLDLDLGRKAPKSEPDRTERREAVRNPQQAVRNPPQAVRTAEQAEQEEAGHTLQPTADRTHPVEVARTSVVHTHLLDTGSEEEEGAHRARTPVERDKQDRSRNTLVVASSPYSGCKAVAEGGRRMRVVEGIVDYSLGTTCLI